MEIDQLTDKQRKDLEIHLTDKKWRMNNLYYIIDKWGKKIQFKFLPEQEELFNNIHNRMVILKARQLGMTTFFCVYFLDDCLFYPNIRAGIVAHNLDDAQVFFRDKVKYAYDNAPVWLKKLRPYKKNDGGELLLDHGNNQQSGIRVGTSLRSGTFHDLLVSEYGKLCAKYPEKAREVRTGALNTVSPNQMVIIEATAEGNEGHFFEICRDSELLQKSGQPLTPMDYKFFFFPWWERDEYSLKTPKTGLVVPKRFSDYFDKLKKEHNIKLSDKQKYWYIKKEEEQGEDMKREYPSTSEEAFEASIEGTYYSRQISEATEQGRITKVPFDPSRPVDCYWDLGIADYMAIWFAQNIGREVHIINYLEGSDEGFPYYIEMFREMATSLKYTYGRQIAPHDIMVRELSTGKSRLELAQSLGINFEIAPNLSVEDGINAVRIIFPLCWFDAEKCDKGISHLMNYRKMWNQRLGQWSKTPRHDEHSHGADAFRILAVSHDFSGGGAMPLRKIKTASSKGWS